MNLRQVVVVLVLALWVTVAAGQTRTFTPADTLKVANVADAQIAPDGKTVIYTVTTTASETASRTALWWVKANAGGKWDAPQPFLAGDWAASAPRWSPDGKRVAFAASRDNQSGLWVADIATRQPRFVAATRGTNFHLAYVGESFAWSPDGKRLAYISAVEEGAKPDEDPRVIDRIQYKSRTAFSDNLRTHVFVTEVDNERATPRQLTAGPHYDHALTWSPDGQELAFLSNLEPVPDALNNSDIYAVKLDGNTRQITKTPGCEYEPRWSPDGKYIAYTATTRDVTTIDSVAEDTHVWVIEAQTVGGKGRDLTAKQDRRARSPRWAENSRAIYFLAGNYGLNALYRIRPGVSDDPAQMLQLFFGRDGAGTPIAFTDRFGASPQDGAIIVNGKRGYQIGNFSVTPQPVNFRANGGKIFPFSPLATVLSTPAQPGEVWAQTEPEALLIRASTHNTAFALAFINAESFTGKSFDSAEIQGWLMKPVGWREGEKYPLILSVHGGPHGSYGYGFNATFQAYAARGYAVLFLNPRGSTGYGQKFSDGTLREWGGGDYKDLMAGVDEALRRYSWLDENRMGVVGGSYGGFMVNWIITQTPRFKAAVASASVSNLISFYGTSLYQDLLHAEFGGFPWDDYDLLWRWSPLRYVKSVQTPTMFIHGELDNDVHITQAEEMYMALRRRNVPTVLVRYPREGHGFREPQHRRDALEKTLDWFDKYLK